MTETTPLRELDVRTVDGCRVLSSPDLGYADGAEQRLYDIVQAASDLSSSSLELAEAATDWGTTYSLVPTRANVVRGLDLPPDAKVLEIGCGCGPITRYLGEQCAVVDSVEPMPARARVARARSRDLTSVEVFVGTLDDVPAVPTYDVVMVIGVLEYVGLGVLDADPYLTFLRQCHAVLKDGGTLVVAIENPLGVKYISGAVEDHTNRPFDSLEGYALQSPARTFPRQVLQGLLADSGFASEVLAAFPDYKLPRAVMNDTMFRASEQLAEGLPRFPSPDYLVPRLNLADEGLTWSTLVASGVAEHFANSFIALATKGSGPRCGRATATRCCSTPSVSPSTRCAARSGAAGTTCTWCVVPSIRSGPGPPVTTCPCGTPSPRPNLWSPAGISSRCSWRSRPAGRSCCGDGRTSSRTPSGPRWTSSRTTSSSLPATSWSPSTRSGATAGTTGTPCCCAASS
ncbi:class I SAM-dependent methyltransferase [Blastococcus brunescens]|uniref:Class I SAM-dependent methyltransferase n=1 Tax=Blastococcus brunescens TaxID=1564165 RepID=A0ABZ1AWV6_9ACTN|nr:class I SAM-dependent methyltransferase [Blastococcus sp. BMG 8361]WRL62939.1 class I SAM-dependent methyltransferase [Blastococcus sp. BMG 8361]